jgi:hypothetical protein
MICKPCRDKDHEACKINNANKTPSACECQHRVKPEPLVLPAETKLQLEVIFAK